MNTDILKEFISTLVFLLPVLGLVWKGAKLTAKLEQLEKTVNEKTNKFCTDHRTMENKIEEQKEESDKNIDAIMATLTEIQKSIVRIETKLEVMEGKN